MLTIKLLSERNSEKDPNLDLVFRGRGFATKLSKFLAYTSFGFYLINKKNKISLIIKVKLFYNI